MPYRRRPLIPLLALLSACGGSSNGPAGPTGPSVPGETYTVQAEVFYDENGNGQLDPQEGTRLPGVTAAVAGHTGVSTALLGVVTIAGVPAGTQTIAIRPETLPPFWSAGPPLTIQVPQTVTARLPVTLPIGRNQPNLYMAFGDSITIGDGSSDGAGYTKVLEGKLQAYLGRANVENQGADGTRSNQGAARIQSSLDRVHPAYALIIYGTNDWNAGECKDRPPCYTIASLRTIVETCKSHQSLPVLSTIPPVNVGYDFRTPPDRQEWVSDQNKLVSSLAKEEGAVLVDIFTALVKQPNLSSLFSDHVHPNDAGYAIIADEFFKAITRPAGSSSAGFLESAPAPDPLRFERPAPARERPGLWPRPPRER